MSVDSNIHRKKCTFEQEEFHYMIMFSTFLKDVVKQVGHGG